MKDPVKLNNYIELLKNTKCGVLSVYIGSLVNENDEWSQDAGFCVQEAKGIHEKISDLYKVFVGSEPVNYLFDHFKRHPEAINKDYYAYSFSVDTNIFHIEEASNSTVTYNNNSYKMIEDARGDTESSEDPLGGEEVREYIKKYIFNELTKESFINKESYEKFEISQQAFTNAVGYAYNQKGLPFKYATIILLTYKRDGCSFFSHSIVLFSSQSLSVSGSTTNEDVIIDPTLQLIFENIRSDKYLDRIEELSKKLQKESEKSAKAAIMSRNMSHNLGSHVMAYLKQHLSSVHNMLNDRILTLLFENEKDLGKKLPNVNSIEDDVALPFLTGLGQFISYLQERQDFIATIATDFIPYNSNINFKDFIYDELNPDKRYERHTERTTSMKIDNILLGNIARSEGLGRPTSPTKKGKGRAEYSDLSDIVIRFRNFDGNSVVKNTTAWKDLEAMRNYNVSLPGGVVGRQAVFSIVENVIRNAAKHGNWREAKKLEITFDIYSKSDLNKRHFNRDNYNTNHKTLKQVLTDFYCNSDDGDDLYYVTITDNLSFSEESLGKLRQAIAGRYVDEKGEMINTNKGIKEMRISSSWLRSFKDDIYQDIDNFDFKHPEWDRKWGQKENHKAPILYARISAEKKSGKVVGNHLQYIFCLPKPKIVAIVSPLFEDGDVKIGNSFLRYSWNVFSLNDFLSCSNKSYEFIIFDDRNDSYNGIKDKNNAKETIESWYGIIRRKTSSRLSRLSSLSNIKIVSDIIEKRTVTRIQARKVEKMLYKSLANFDPGVDVIEIDDEKTTGLYKVRNKKVEGRIAIRIYDGKAKEDRTIKTAVENNHTLVSESKRRYIYRTHHEVASEFCNFFKFTPSNKYLFVEGITGNNSSDRLVRNEEINDEWFYRHLHSMKEKVAIFDERLFAKIFGLEEPDLKTGGGIINMKNMPSLWDNYLKTLDDKDVLKMKKKSASEKIDILKKNRVVKDVLSIRSKTYMPTAYEQKGVYLFTIVRSVKNEKEFNVYGIKHDTDENIRKNSSKKSGYVSTCIRLLTFSWNDKTKKLVVKNKTKDCFMGLFDHISIHQGLLDKLYDAFGIKGESQSKEKLTKAFYELFSSQNVLDYEENSEKRYFLPGMCIHSGRSKPSEEDMPQRLPFIQYATIEHAVLDCKYSLVELLDFARYQDE